MESTRMFHDTWLKQLTRQLKMVFRRECFTGQEKGVTERENAREEKQYCVAILEESIPVQKDSTPYL